MKSIERSIRGCLALSAWLLASGACAVDAAPPAGGDTRSTSKLAEGDPRGVTK